MADVINRVEAPLALATRDRRASFGATDTVRGTANRPLAGGHRPVIGTTVRRGWRCGADGSSSLMKPSAPRGALPG